MLPILALILGPPVIALVLGGLQLAVYAALQRSGRVQEDDVPPFILLVLRGFLILLACVAVAAILAFLTKSGPDPLWGASGAPVSSPAAAPAR
jgi:hypothetical protein